MRLVGTVMVGVSDDEPERKLTEDAKNTLINILGVDLTSLVYRGKFVFVAQVGSPQKAVYELRDDSPPGGIGMDVLITGLSLNSNRCVLQISIICASDSALADHCACLQIIFTYLLIFIPTITQPTYKYFMFYFILLLWK